MATIDTYVDVPLRLVFAGDRISYGYFQYTSDFTPVVTSCKFLPDVSGLAIDFDIPTNKGSSTNVDPNSIVYQTTDEIFLDPLRTLGTGGLVTWLNPQQLIVSFGENPTCTSSTFLQIQPFTIASASDHHAFVSGQFLPDVIPDNQIPATTAVITVPENVSYCSDWSVSGSASAGGGGRPLGFGWDVRVLDTESRDVNTEWATTLRTKIRSISRSELIVHYNATWNISGSELSVCPPCVQGFTCPDTISGRKEYPCCRCDLLPGYSYVWRLVTYNWLWSPTSGCGSVPVPEKLWTSPEMFRLCPAMSMNTGTEGVCDALNVSAANKACPWTWAKIFIDNTISPTLSIQGPNFMSINSGQNVALTAKLIPSVCASPASNSGSPAQLVHMVRHRWRLFQVRNKNLPFDACTSQSNLDILMSSNSSSLNQFFDSTYFSGSQLYTVSVESLADEALYSAERLCTSIQIWVSMEALQVEITMGIYKNATATQLDSAEFGPDNHGVDIGDSQVTDPSKQTQVARFKATVLNRQSDPAVKYTYTWNCRHWVLDTYQPWVSLSSLKAAPDPHVVVACNCTPDSWKDLSGPCPVPYTGSSGIDPGSQANVNEKAYISNFNTTFEYSVLVQEYVSGKIARAVTAVKYATFYHQSEIAIQLKGMMDRNVDINIAQSSTTSVRVLSKAVAGQPLLLTGIANGPMSSLKICNPENDLVSCTYQWTVLSESLNLNNPNISRFGSKTNIQDPTSTSTLLYINSGSVPAAMFFMFRLYAWNDGINGGAKYIINFRDFPVNVSDLPRNGAVSIDPTCGSALFQKFTVQATGWTGEPDDLPLSYSFASRRSICDSDFISFATFSYAQEAVLVPSFCPEGGGSCLGTASSNCTLHDIQLTVRTQYYSTAMAYTSANVWSPEWSGGPTYAQGANCNDLTAPQEKETYANRTIQNALDSAFIYSDYESTFTSLTNLASVAGMDSDQTTNSLNIALKEIIGGMVTNDLLPSDSNVMEMMAATLANLFTSPSGKKYVCQSIGSDQIILAQALVAMTRNAASEGMELQQKALQSIVDVFDVIVQSRPPYSCSSSRRAMSSEDINALRNVSEDLVLNLCQTQLGSLLGGENMTALTASTFSLQFNRKPTNVNQVLLNVLPAGVSPCGPIDLISAGEGVQSWLESRIDVCVQVFFYDPVSYPNRKSMSLYTDGQDQSEYGVSWPVSSGMCPVMAIFRTTVDGFQVWPTVEISFDLSNNPLIARNWFTPKSPDLHSLNPSWSSNPQPFNVYAYDDISFAGSCQQWADSDDSTSVQTWAYDFDYQNTQIFDTSMTLINSPSTFNLSGVDVCQKMHIPVDPDPTTLASSIKCTFLASPNGKNPSCALPSAYTLRPLYAIISERADCQGVPDTPEDLMSYVDFDIGQLEFARNLSDDSKSQHRKSRQVCDRCARCGGFDEGCTLSCDGDLKSTRVLDQCGICGGSCVAPGCPTTQCSTCLVIFSANSGPSVTRVTFGRSLQCPTSGDTNCKMIRTLNSCPGGCPREVMQQTFLLDSTFLSVYEGSTYVFEPGNLTLQPIASSEVFTMYICILNEACAQYVLGGTEAGNTPTCERLYTEQPSCFVECNHETDLWDPNILCAGGTLSLSSSSATCKMLYTKGNTTTIIQCTGTPAMISAALSRLQFVPPVRYTSGKPPLNFLTMRFTFDDFSPMVYRKDISITVLPVNNAPVVEGGQVFSLQEDRPSALNASTSRQPLSISIYDDAEFQNGSYINVQFSISTNGMDNKSLYTALSIGGSQVPPLCPGCFEGVILVDQFGCRCAGGNSDEMATPWYTAEQSFTIIGPTKYVNLTLQSLEFQSGPNMNEFSPKYTNGGVANVLIGVSTADNGFADQRRTIRQLGLSSNLTGSGSVTIKYTNENDPPVVFMPMESVLFQTGSSKIVGSYVVDADWFEYSSDTASPSYQVSIQATVGKMSVNYSSPNCKIDFPAFVLVARQAQKTSTPPFLATKSDAHVEERDPLVSFQGKNSYGLLVDGTVSCPGDPELGCTRVAYMLFDLTNEYPIAYNQWPWPTDLASSTSPWSDILAYDGSTVTLRLYRIGCAKTMCNASASPGDPQACEAGSCHSDGNISVKEISCNVQNWLTSGLTFDSLSLLNYQTPPVLLGSAFVNHSSTDVWLEVPLNISAIGSFRSSALPSYQDKLCLILEGDPAQNETIVFFGGTISLTPQQYTAQISDPLYKWYSFPSKPDPELALVRGRAWSCVGINCEIDCTGSNGTNIFSPICMNTSADKPGSLPSPCSVNVMNGTGTRDQSILFESGIDPINMILNEIDFQMDSLHSNIFHQANISNVTITVQDMTAKYPTISSGGWASDGEDLLYISQATTYIKIITIKTGPLSVQMMPLYYETWLNKLLFSGNLPAYVMLEDCGNRPIADCENCDADCPTKLQVVPTSAGGAEAAFAQMAVEITVKLGYITVPKSIRPFLTFQKGTGYRDSSVRFYGQANYVRAASLALVYHTFQDQSVEYKNDLVGKCSRPCFLNDIAPAKFLNTKEPDGCEQGCSSDVYSRVNNFAETINGEPSGTYLDSIFVTFEDKGSTGIGLVNYIQVLMYTIYTLAVNDKPCIIFGTDEISVDCRQNCANVQWSSVCSPVYDQNMDVISSAGLPFDVTPPIGAGVRNYREGDTSPVKIGALLIKPIDLYESSSNDCKNNLLAALAQRGEAGYVLPDWVVNCPQIAVSIQALRGEVSLNNR